MQLAVNKICSITNIPIHCLLQDGLGVILSAISCDKHLVSSPLKVRSIVLFGQLSEGTQFIRNLAVGTVEHCTSQLHNLNLYQLIRIRLNQPALFEVPDSLMSHFRFMRTIDQYIFERFADYVIEKNSTKSIEEYFSVPSDPNIKQKFCYSARSKFGKEMILACGLQVYLRKKNLLSFSEKVKSGLPMYDQLLNCKSYWWRILIEIPNCNVNSSNTVSSKQSLSKTLPCIRREDSENPRLARVRRSMQNARSLSVEATRRTIRDSGATLVNLFILIPTFELSTDRPLKEEIIVCEECDWVACQTIGSVSTVAEAANIRCNILMLSPEQDLSQFLRPCDTSYAIRTELATRIKSRSNHQGDVIYKNFSKTKQSTATTPRCTAPSAISKIIGLSKNNVSAANRSLFRPQTNEIQLITNTSPNLLKTPRLLSVKDPLKELFKTSFPLPKARAPVCPDSIVSKSSSMLRMALTPIGQIVLTTNGLSVNGISVEKPSLTTNHRIEPSLQQKLRLYNQATARTRGSGGVHNFKPFSISS